MSEASPAEMKPEEPRGLITKLGAALPIGLTAIATVFAGMSTGELQKAMYWKSQAAQDQAKATNQWTLFGFKRSRALEMETAAARSRADSGYLRFQFLPGGDGSTGVTGDAAKWLNGEGPPRTELPPPEYANLAQLVKDIKDRKPEHDLQALAGKIPVEVINKAIDDAENFIEKTTNKEWDDVVKTAKILARKVIDESARNKTDEPVDAAKKARADAVQGMVFAMEDRRYRGEGALNNALGYLYEARVKFSSAESDKHRKKSEHFFYAMLVAQIGAVISSLALARKTGSLLWLFAGLAGALAIGFGAVVLLDKLPGE
jgi:hypothetical protein